MKKKSLFVNFIYNALYNSMSVLFPLITTPYISRILMADGLGKVSYATNIVSWFLVFASLGIPRYGVREIARAGQKRDIVFSELFFLNLICSIVCIVAYYMLIINNKYFESKIVLYEIVGLQLVLNIFNVDWFYQGIEQYGYITKRSFFVKVISLFAMFCFVKCKSDYIKYALIQTFAVAGNNCFNFLYLRKYLNITFKKLNVLRHIKPVMVLLSTQIAVNVYSLLDTTMLGILCTDSVVGYYSNTQKIIRVISTCTASLGGVMLPQLTQHFYNNDIQQIKNIVNKVVEIILIFCLPISLGIMMESKNIVLILFGSDFLPAQITLKIFAPFVLITTIGNLYGTQMLMAFGEEKRLLFSVILGSITNFSLNIFLIRNYEQNGAAMATVITELIVLLVQRYYVNKKIKVKIGYNFLVSTLFMNLTLMLVVWLINVIAANIYLELILSVVLGGIIYLGIGILLKNEILLYFFDFMGNKFASK